MKLSDFRGNYASYEYILTAEADDYVVISCFVSF